MNNIVLQPHGIGDAIFCQQLVKNLAAETGFGPIVWPVLPQFIEGLRRAYPGVCWIPTGVVPSNWETIKMDRVINGNRIIPIRFADQIQKVPYQMCMRSKYDMYHMDWKDWGKTMFDRNHQMEELLCVEIGLDITKPFCLVNRNFTSVGGKTVLINPKTELQIVEMRTVEGFSLFDWAGIIEAATEIHTVSTSIIYLLELLEIKCNPHIYIRRPDESNHKNYDYILRRHSYILM